MNLFELPVTATRKEIKKKFKILALKYHPDKSNDPNANIIFGNLKDTYEKLLKLCPREDCELNINELKSLLKYKEWFEFILFINKRKICALFSNESYDIIVKYIKEDLEVSSCEYGKIVIFKVDWDSLNNNLNKINLCENKIVYTHHGYIYQDNRDNYLHFLIGTSYEDTLRQINEIISLINKYDEKELKYSIEEKIKNF
jgi:hypothetical protein